MVDSWIMKHVNHLSWSPVNALKNIFSPSMSIKLCNNQNWHNTNPPRYLLTQR
jgi:hypothetical protein